MFHWPMFHWLMFAMLLSGCLAVAAHTHAEPLRLGSTPARDNQSDRLQGQLERRQQLDQERLRAERGWQLHPRQPAPLRERRREDELRREVPRDP